MALKNTDYKNIVISTLIGLVSAIATSMVLSLLFSFILTFTGNPLAYTDYASFFLVLLSFICGAIVSSNLSQSPFISSVACAAIHLMLMALLGALFSNEKSEQIIPKVIICFSALAVTIITWLCVMKFNNRKNRNKHRYRKFK